jgi:hypothetical protein
VDHDELLSKLDFDIKRFRIDYERFFSGNLPIPPDQLRIKIQDQIKLLRTERIKAVAQRFRLNGLEAKFNALNVLFNRRLRDFELGTGANRPTPETTGSEFDPSLGVVVDEKPSSEAVRALYEGEGLYAKSKRDKKTDFDSFQIYLKKQATQIREKTGCSQVRFRVASEDGKLKLKAKPE